MADLVTIVVPIYKVESYLKKCLDSIVSQTYVDLEIILVPQPGEDECEAICREYEKKDNRVIVLPQTVCDLSHARNVGIAHSHGEYIAFIDSDDMINSQYVEVLYGLIQEHKADIAECSSYAFIDEANIAKRIDKKFINVHSGKEMCYKLFENTYGTDAGVIQTKLYKKHLFDTIKFPEGRLNEDGATNYKLYWNSDKIVVTGQKLYYYRSKRSDSIIHTISDRLSRDSLISARECKEFYKTMGEEFLYINALYVYCNNIIRIRNRNSSKKDEIQLLKEEQKEAVGILIKSEKISRKKKILSLVGYLCPSLWGIIWNIRNKSREVYEWKIKGVRK